MSGIVYIHVPKCGGSSFGAALRMRFVLSQSTITLNQGNPRLAGRDYVLSDYDARDDELKRLMEKNIRLISGHVRYHPSVHQWCENQYSFVTLLRDPVQRFVSHYYYLQRKHPNAKRPDTLKKFLDTEDAQRLASQYLFYFARLDQTMGANTNRLIHKALNNLERFALIGDLARPQEFVQGLNRLSGKKLPIWHRNKAPEPAFVEVDLLKPIQELCAADIEIYRTVQERKMAA